MRSVLSWLLLAAVYMLSQPAGANDCEKLLVPDFKLPGLDPTTDLAYLAAVTPENFAAHKANAVPMFSHIGVPLPIAGQLLQHANTYAEFASERAKKYTELGFDHPQTELAAYYRRLLPKARFDEYSNCTDTSGFAAEVTRADRDFVLVMASWRPAPGGAAQVPIKSVAVVGATLATPAPQTLQRTPTELVFVRNRNADLRWSAQIAGQTVDLWVPRFLAAAASFGGAQAPCADASISVRALYRQLLEREPTPGERAAQSAWLKSGANNVSQLAARLVLGEEYEKRFVRGKTFDDVLLGLYRHALARIPDEKGLKSNQAQFRNATFPTIALAFLDNGEYERRFGEWNVPGEPMTMRYCSERK